MVLRLDPSNPADREFLEKRGLGKELFKTSSNPKLVEKMAETPHVKKSPRESKYGNSKFEADGMVWDSVWERECWLTLRILEREGKISDLTRQHHIDFIYNDIKIWRCVLDFRFKITSKDLFVYADAKTEVTTKNRIWRTTVNMVKAFESCDIMVFSKTGKNKADVYNTVLHW